jgi:DNA-binding transcriptional MerR regulator
MIKKRTPLENPGSASALYNIGIVTRLTGIPAASLHSWERRYGFPTVARTAGGHRLYSEKDIARLRWVKSQVDSGLTISRAVIAVRALETGGQLYMPRDLKTGPNLDSNTSGSSPARTSLMEAFTHHDLALADQLMGEMLVFNSPEDLILDVIGPALNSIGEAWEQGQITIATEHLASNYLRQRLLMWMVTGPPPRAGNPIVLACAPGEWHEGSLLMLGVLLRRQGWPVVYLGQNVPFNDLAKFIDDLHPSAVVLVAMCDEPARVLIDWPHWIKQQGSQPLIAFGGRAFVVQPELQVLVPGLFLGTTIQDGLMNLISSLQQAIRSP